MTGGQSTVMVVDDDDGVRALLGRYLGGEGFKVVEASSGSGMRARLAESAVDLVLMDVNLKGAEDGFALVRSLREHSPDTAVIMVTGRGDTIDRVLGLEMGADDYITKPFQLREVLARINSVLRRLRGAARSSDDGAATADDAILVFSGWQLDLSRRVVQDPDGAEVALTTGEFDLLRTFAENATRVLTRDRLMDLAKHRDWTPFDRAIDTQVGRLRKKLECDPRNPKMIKTVRGAGYVFTPKVDRL